MEEKDIKKDKKEKEKKEKKEVRDIVLIILLLFALVLLVIGVTYEVFNYANNGSAVGTGNGFFGRIFGGPKDIFKNGSVTIVYTEGDNAVSIENALPLTDEEGMNNNNPNETMDFTISVNITKNSNVTYQVVAEKDPKSTIDEKYIKIYLQRSMNGESYNEEILKPTIYNGIKEDNDFGVPKGDMILDEVNTSSSITHYYRLRMWLDKSYPVDDQYKFFTIKINVYGKGDRIKSGKEIEESKTSDNK